MVSSLPRGSSIRRARRSARARSSWVCPARASRSRLSASSTARWARSRRSPRARVPSIARSLLHAPSPFGRGDPVRRFPSARARGPCNSYLWRTSRRRHRRGPLARNIPPNKAVSLAPRMQLRACTMSLLGDVSQPSGRILVVDDDPRARDLIVSSLRADGHDVDASGNGLEALRLLGREWYDVIVSNLRMPELDGPSLYSAVTRRWPAPPPLLFLAGLGGTSEYDGFLKVIRAHVLPKPFTIRALRRAIKEML